MEGSLRIPYFVEPAPGRFLCNPKLDGVVVSDDRLRTLTIPTNTPAKIPASGLPIEVLRYLVQIGLNPSEQL
jgi:hypothetical protein